MKNGLTRGQSFLVGKAPELDAQTRLDITNKKLRFVDLDKYLRVSVTGKAGIIILLDETNIRKAGITNWNDNKLEKGINLVLEQIRFGYGKSTTNDINPAHTSFSTKLSLADIAIQNAEFRIKQDGKLIVAVPVARLMSEEVSKSIQGHEDAYKLNSLQLLKENSPVTLEIEFPAGSTVDAAPGNQHFIEIRLMGTATAPR